MSNSKMIKQIGITPGGKTKKVSDITELDIWLGYSNARFMVSMNDGCSKKQAEMAMYGFDEWISDCKLEAERFRVSYDDADDGTTTITIVLGNFLNGRKQERAGEELRYILDSYLVEREEVEPEKKPAETKPAGDKPKAEAKPAEKATEPKTATPKPAEKKPAEKTTEPKTVTPKPVEKKPAEKATATKPADSKPKTEVKPDDSEANKYKLTKEEEAMDNPDDFVNSFLSRHGY